MPELPEVETIRRDLQGEVVGRKIKSVEVRNGRTVRRHPSAKQFRAQLEGRTFRSIDRAGKYLLLGLDDGATLVVHLGMSGQLQRVKNAKEPKVPAHPCRDHLHPGRPAALRRPADLRRALRVRRSRPRASGPCPSSPIWGSTRSRT